MIRMVAAGSSLLLTAVLLVGKDAERGIHLVFADVASLLLILVMALGTIAWMVYISWSHQTMKRSLQNLVTREDLDTRLKDFRRSLSGKGDDVALG